MCLKCSEQFSAKGMQTLNFYQNLTQNHVLDQQNRAISMTTANNNTTTQHNSITQSQPQSAHLLPSQSTSSATTNPSSAQAHTTRATNVATNNAINVNI